MAPAVDNAAEPAVAVPIVADSPAVFATIRKRNNGKKAQPTAADKEVDEFAIETPPRVQRIARAARRGAYVPTSWLRLDTP